MTDRTVSVRLRMLVRDYVAGGNDATRATRQLREAQVQLGHTARKTGDDLTKSARQVQVWGDGVRRAVLITSAAAIGAGGALQYLAPAAVAAGAGVGVLPGIFGGAAAAAGTLKIATIGVGDALDDLYKTDDPYARLSPSARKLVNDLGRLKPQLLAVQEGIQNATLASAAGNLDRLAKDTLPTLNRQALVLAHDWSLAMTAVTDTATDPQVLSAFTSVTMTTDRFFDQILTRIQPLGQALASITQSADPLARLVGDRLVGAIDRFTTGVQRARQSGNLDEFFQSGADSAGALLSITGDLLGLTGQVVSAVNRQNTSIVGTARSLDAYLASGRAAEDIAGIVDTLTASYQGAAEVLGPLGSIARDALADPATREGLATMFDILAAGSATLRLLFDLYQALPDPIQSVVVAAVALGFVASKTAGTVTAMGVAAQTAATRLTAMGGGAEKAGRGLSTLTVGAGKAVTALVALQLAGVVFEQFEPAAANVDALADAVERFATKGELSGELTRLFGEDLDNLNKIAGAAASDGILAKLGRAAESLVPPVKSLNEIFQGGSFTEAPERIRALDAAISEYAKRTNDVTGTNEAWNRVLNASGLDAAELTELLPRTTEELSRLNNATQTGAGSMAALEARTKLLSGGMNEAVTAGRSLIDVFNELNGKAIGFAEAEIDAEEKVDELTATLKENGKALNKQGSDFDVNTAKGRANKQATIELLEAGAEAAQKKLEETDSVEAASAVYDKYVGKLRKVLHDAGLTDKQIDTLISTYGEMPDEKSTEVKAPGAAKATQQVQDFNFAVKSVPPSKTVPFRATVAEAKAAVEALRTKINQLKDKHVYISGTVRWTSSGDFKVPGGTQLKNRWGGVHKPTAMAGGGVMQANVYPASSPPLMQFAEPETGGEAYIPRRGNRARNLAILSEAAAWNNAVVVPMAGGGIMAAASGMVQYAPSTSAATAPARTRGTRLESIEAYVQARDAVARLSAALKENGRSFSVSTAKGRENYQSVISAVRAAQDAAEAKYAETGSVKAANKEYDAHIARLKAVLAQRKVSASQIRSLMASLSARPVYDVPTPTPVTPVGSSRNIAAMEARIGAEEALVGLRDHFSLVKPVFDVKDETGRENLRELFSYLKQAQEAAQAVLEQTNNRKTAESVYNGYVAQLRTALTASGASKALIDSLLGQYGKIVLTPNLAGGVYGPRGSSLMALSEGGLWSSGNTLYGFAERGTGGELFLPRFGSRRRGEDLLSVGAGWYGGRYVPSGQTGGGSTQVTNNLTVNGANHRLTLPELQGLLRQMDARARVGRKN